MSSFITVGQYVTCPRIGDGKYKVLEIKPSTREFVLDVNETRINVFQIHCFKVSKTVSETNEERKNKKEAADKIGNNTHISKKKRR